MAGAGVQEAFSPSKRDVRCRSTARRRSGGWTMKTVPMPGARAFDLTAGLDDNGLWFTLAGKGKPWCFMRTLGLVLLLAAAAGAGERDDLFLDWHADCTRAAAWTRQPGWLGDASATAAAKLRRPGGRLSRGRAGPGNEVVAGHAARGPGRGPVAGRPLSGREPRHAGDRLPRLSERRRGRPAARTRSAWATPSPTGAGTWRPSTCRGSRRPSRSPGWPSRSAPGRRARRSSGSSGSRWRPIRPRGPR